MKLKLLACISGLTQLGYASPCMVPTGTQLHPELSPKSAHVAFSNGLTQGDRQQGKRISLEFKDAGSGRTLMTVNEKGVVWQGKRLCGWDDPMSEYRRLTGCPKDLPIRTSQIGAYTIRLFVEIKSYEKGIASLQFRDKSLRLRIPFSLRRSVELSEEFQRAEIERAINTPPDQIAKVLDDVEKCIQAGKQKCFPATSGKGDDQTVVRAHDVLPILKHRTYPQIRFATRERPTGSNETKIELDLEKVYIDDASCMSIILQKMDDGWHLTDVVPNGA